MPPTYITSGAIPDGTITTTVIEQEWLNGKPFLKRCFTTVSGDKYKRKENKKVKIEKRTQKVKEEQQQKLDGFSKVDSKESGF